MTRSPAQRARLRELERAQTAAMEVEPGDEVRCVDCRGEGAIPYQGEPGDRWLGTCVTCKGSGWAPVCSDCGDPSIRRGGRCADCDEADALRAGR